MKKISFLIILTIFCLFIFEQCRKSRCIGTYRFTDEQKNILPYHGGEHLIFKDSLGNTASFDVQEPVLKVQSRNDLTGEDYFNSEFYEIPPLGINIYFYDPSKSPVQIGFSIWGFYFKNYPVANGGGTPGFGGNWLYESGELKRLKDGMWSGIDYYDSLTILNKTFYSVYDLYGYGGSHDSSLVYRNLYYNIQQGIIGVRTLDGFGNWKNWYLE
jgi:hypothetical protein